MKTPAPLDARSAQERVLGWQTKLHRWAVRDERACFDDLFNLVCDPATLLVAWERVKRNRGSRTAGVDDLGVVDALEVNAAPRGAMRREMKDERHLIRAGWKAGPGPMQRPGEAGGRPGAGSRAAGRSAPTM